MLPRRYSPLISVELLCTLYSLCGSLFIFNMCNISHAHDSESTLKGSNAGTWVLVPYFPLVSKHLP